MTKRDTRLSPLVRGGGISLRTDPLHGRLSAFEGQLRWLARIANPSLRSELADMVTEYAKLKRDIIETLSEGIASAE